MITSDVIALTSAIISAAALTVAYAALARSNKNSSAAALIPLYEALRQAWTRYLFATDGRVENHEFHELLNLLEMSCAIHFDGALVGNSSELMYEYLRDVLCDFNQDAAKKNRIATAVQADSTFKYIARFIRTYKASFPTPKTTWASNGTHSSGFPR